MTRDYYWVLGVPWDAAPEAIRSAYRRLALRYHPDRGKAADSRSFREVTEAYGVLSDPDRRARYDRRIHGYRAVAPFGRAAEQAPESLISDPVSVTGRPEMVRPSLDALLERFGRNFAGRPAPKAEHPEPLNYELILSPDEAERGVRIPFRVPVMAICRLCGGTGRDWSFPCGDCGGEGRRFDPRTVDVNVPAGVRDRACFDVSLSDLGVRNLWLRLHVRVERTGT